jgi:glycosyltransferase involved in cell wall biosynthesis
MQDEAKEATSPVQEGGKEPRVLVLIPAWNEETRIGPVIEEAKEHLPVLVVDDGSTDETAEVAEASGATVVRHDENRRKGAALRTGFDWAMERGYDAVITLDADGQHDATEIPKLLEAFEANAGELIIGERSFSEMAWPRPVTTRLGAWMLSLALGTRVTDNQSGYRLLTRHFIENANLTSAGFEMEVEMIWEAVRLGMAIGWVPIRTIYGINKDSYFHPFRDTVHFLRMVWDIWKRRRELERTGSTSSSSGAVS